MSDEKKRPVRPRRAVSTYGHYAVDALAYVDEEALHHLRLAVAHYRAHLKDVEEWTEPDSTAFAIRRARLESMNRWSATFTQAEQRRNSWAADRKEAGS